MALNKIILKKLADKTDDDIEMREFLSDVLQYESTPKNKWYEKKYSELLDKHCKEDE